ncbi:M48 family metalloprotease [Marinimicrobium agarilyticum]|uniref:M48 family metalloprotease n=1 Tax=Marinimicrobium agarilyticum TaxID=306546 RepID=UPI000420D98B|nr:M48 family metalloprotease [Marinimicrobium agarilyticum]
MKTRLIPLIAVALALGISACSVNPVTGERELTIMSAEDEIAAGAENYLPSRQAQGGRYVVDPELELYVSDVMKKLAAVSDRPGLPYEITVLNNDVPNAWALPGGKMAINRGLLMELDDEAQLASVLGHEIVHAAARHSAQQQTQNLLLQVGMVAAGVAASQSDSDYAGLAMGAVGVGATAWQAQYSQAHELEADRYGIEYMAKAGYDPQAAVELQKTFVRLSEGKQSGWLEGFLSSHPPSQKRVARNRELAAQYNDGVLNEEAYQRAIAQLREDQDAYKNYQQAQKAAADENYSQALGLVEKAIQDQPRENLFWELKGRLLLEQEQEDDALKAFDRAVAANPEFFRPLVYRGLLNKQKGNAQQAQRDLEASQNLLPTQLASYHLGELAQQRGDRSAAVNYYQQAASGGGDLGQAAQAKLSQLGVTQ